MRATGGGTMTRFRQVTSPASGLLRSVILDSVLFGNRLKLGGGARHDQRRTTLRDCALRFWSVGARCPAVLRADRGDRGVTTGQLASSSTSARVWAVRTRVDQRNRVSAFRALLGVGLQLLVVAHGTAFKAPSGAAADAGVW